MQLTRPELAMLLEAIALAATYDPMFRQATYEALREKLVQALSAPNEWRDAIEKWDAAEAAGEKLGGPRPRMPGGSDF